MAAEPLISAANITKKFGDVTAVSDISIDAYSGGIYGVAGLNGAGKSTLLSILAGVLRPDGGTVTYRGVPVYPRRVKNSGILRIGYVPQDIALFPDLTVHDNLAFWAHAGGVSNRKDVCAISGSGQKPLKERIRESAEIAGLSGKLRAPVHTLSGGLKRRVNIAAALVAEPEVLIMDEPTAGLDVKNRRDILNFIGVLAREPGKKLSVICTSHQSGELEMISDLLLLLDRGRTVYEGPPGDVFSGRFASYGNIDDILYSMGGSVTAQTV